MLPKILRVKGFRGFLRDNDGPESILLDGKVIKGTWAYWDELGRLNPMVYDIHPVLIRETICEMVSYCKDRNGVQLYEDDVVLYKGEKYKMFYDRTNCAWRLKGVDSGIINLLPSKEEFIVIGHMWSINE